MTDLQLTENINEAVKKAIIETFNSYGIEKKITSSQNAFKKTEQILWNYPMFKNIIQEKIEQINEIKSFGVPSKSKSILEYQAGGEPAGIETEDEKKQGVINNIIKDIEWLENAIYKIDKALESVKKDDIYNIVTRYYFDKVPIVDLANDIGVQASTVSKRKNTLVRKMSIYLFPKETIEDMMEG